jgi:quinol monooxygenase YgiN
MAIYMTAQWRCINGEEARVVAALEEFVAAVGAHEPGTRIYTALQSSDDPTRFLTDFIFETEAAQQIHQSSEWVRRFTSIIYPLNDGEIEFTKYHLVATTG